MTLCPPPISANSKIMKSHFFVCLAGSAEKGHFFIASTKVMPREGGNGDTCFPGLAKKGKEDGGSPNQGLCYCSPERTLGHHNGQSWDVHF